MTGPRKSPELGATIEVRLSELEKWNSAALDGIQKLQDDIDARRKAGAETADVVIDLTKKVHQLELFMWAQIDNRWVERLGAHERDIQQLYTELQNVESLAKRLR